MRLCLWHYLPLSVQTTLTSKHMPYGTDDVPDQEHLDMAALNQGAHHRPSECHLGLCEL